MDELAQQKLYEKWLKKDRWRLRDEAAPLLAGVDPETAAGSGTPDQIWNRLAAAVRHGELTVDNPDAALEVWTAAPAAVYHWATAGQIAVPEAFRALMEFILQTVRPQASGNGDDTEPSAFHAGNEGILGAALSVLAAYPGQCYRRNGGIDLRKVIMLMHEHAAELFGSDGLEYSYERVYDLLQARIKKLVNSES